MSEATHPPGLSFSEFRHRRDAILTAAGAEALLILAAHPRGYTSRDLAAQLKAGVSAYALASWLSTNSQSSSPDVFQLRAASRTRGVAALWAHVCHRPLLDKTSSVDGEEVTIRFTAAGGRPSAT